MDGAITQGGSMITASSLQRVMKCPGSIALPQAPRTTEHADLGTARHAYLRDLATLTQAEALARVPQQHRDACAEIDLSKLPDPGKCRVEAAYVYDVATGKARELGQRREREYGDLAPYEIAGTADVVGLTEDRRIYVADYKGHAEVSDPRENAQLLFLGLTISRAHQIPGPVLLEIIYLRGRHVDVRSAEVDDFDLAEFASRLRRLHLDVAAAKREYLTTQHVDVHAGPWCDHCPAFVHCPSHRQLAADLGGDALVPYASGGALTRAAVPELYRKLKHARTILRRIEATIYAMATDEPIDLGDGTMLGLVEKPGNEQLDGATAHSVIERIGGRDLADAACERSVTKASIARAVKAAAPTIGASASAVEKQILAAIRAAGGASRKSSRSVTEYKKEE